MGVTAWPVRRLGVLAAVVVLAACGSSAAGRAASLRAGTSPPATTAPTTTGPAAGPAPLPVAGAADATLPAPPGPDGRGPAGHQQDLVFTPAGTGFLVTGAFGGSTGEIQRSTDGGATWQTVWSRPGASLYWVGTTGGAVIATGTYATPGSDPNQAAPLLVESTDGGATWSPLTPSLPSPASGSYGGLGWAGMDFDFPTASLGFAVPSAGYGEDLVDPQLLRSTDGGRHWEAVTLPGGHPDGGLAFVDALHGFATGTVPAPGGSAGRPACQSRMWSTADGGATWRAVPGTCVGWLLDAVDFPDPAHGYAAGGNFSKYGMFPQRAVLATTDGGAHWSQVYAAGGNSSGSGLGDGPFDQVRFVDSRTGYALVGGCTMGANGPCGGSLWSSTDGGRTWSRSSQAGLHLALEGPAGVWLVGGGPSGASAMWHSADGAAHWSAVADPATVGITALEGAGSTLYLDTAAGQYISLDGGGSWQPLPPAARAAESGYQQVVAAGPSGLLVVQSPDLGRLWISHDGGRLGATVALPGRTMDGWQTVAFATAADGLAVGQGYACTKPGVSTGAAPTPAPVVATGDGGRSWHPVAGPGLSPYIQGLGYGSSVVVAIGTGPGASSSGSCPTEVATSTDGGTHWRTWSLPAGYHCDTASAAAGTAVLVCPDVAATPQATTIVVSRDAGRTWRAYRLAGSARLAGVIATAAGQLWAYGRSGVLWRSTDGGAHWSALTPRLPLAR